MATETLVRPQAGDDRPVAAGVDLTVLTALKAYKAEADRARRTRLQKSRANLRAYMGEADWSHKQKGQSREFLPKLPMAVEQFASFVKRALVAFGDYFDVEVPPGPLSHDEIRRLILCKLERVAESPHAPVDFATLMSDAVKIGTLQSLVILKVHGRMKAEPRFRVERGLTGMEVEGQLIPQVTERMDRQEFRHWQLLLDLVRDEDYLPDPTGRGLYEIHTVERDLADLVRWAEDGIYDPEAVARIEEDFARQEDEAERARLAGQDVTTAPAFRKRVLIDEFWGTILAPSGRVVKANCLAAMANDQYLIRLPVDNPLWHGESPFVAAPLIRVPFSVWHKAIADTATPLNTAMNELYNLMLDGGIASVWGTRQVRTSWLEDPRQISDGIPQGATLQVNDQCPAGQKVLETVTTGEVPKDALAMLAVTDREFMAAMLTNDLKLGMLPPKQIKATEAVMADQAGSVTVDGIVRDVENQLIKPTLRKVWMTLLQHADDLDADDIVAAIGLRGALALARMSPPQRFAEYAGVSKFRVYGLSAVLARTRDFQKYAALMGMVSTNPLLMQAFVKRFSIDKTLDTFLKTLNIDPATLIASPEELAMLEQRMKELPLFMALAGVKSQGGSGLTPGAMGGDTSLPAEVDTNMANPLATFGK